MNDKATDPTTKTEEAEDQKKDKGTDSKAGPDAALEEAKNKAEENWNLYLRTRADIENIRRRAQIDVENAHKYSIERFAKEMLAVIDSLEQGLQVADSVKDEAYHQGMELTLKLCLDTFEKFNILAINPVGEPFDPTKHEALSAQVSNDMEPNRVISVIQKGFILNDRVLRPARVIVSRREG